MIRAAQATDAPALYQLMQIIWQDMAFEPYLTLPRHHFQHEMLAHIQAPDEKYSFQNCWVYETDGQGVQGLLLGYAGHLEPHYDRRLEARFGRYDRLDDFQLTRESRDDEWYIDMVVVAPEARGRGIAQALLAHLDAQQPAGTILGLNCDLVNPRAKQLYQRLGFQTQDQVQFSGHDYDHMQKVIH